MWQLVIMVVAHGGIAEVAVEGEDLGRSARQAVRNRAGNGNRLRPIGGDTNGASSSSGAGAGGGGGGRRSVSPDPATAAAAVGGGERSRSRLAAMGGAGPSLGGHGRK